MPASPAASWACPRPGHHLFLPPLMPLSSPAAGRLPQRVELLAADSQLLSRPQLFCCWSSWRSKCQITRGGHRRRGSQCHRCPCPGEGIPAGTLAGDFRLPCAALPLGGLPGRTLLFLLFLSSPSWRVCAKPSWAGPGPGADKRGGRLSCSLAKKPSGRLPLSSGVGEGGRTALPALWPPPYPSGGLWAHPPPPLQPVSLETPWLVPPSGPSKERK